MRPDEFDRPVQCHWVDPDPEGLVESGQMELMRMRPDEFDLYVQCHWFNPDPDGLVESE